jgi:hypothetical protein
MRFFASSLRMTLLRRGFLLGAVNPLLAVRRLRSPVGQVPARQPLHGCDCDTRHLVEEMVLSEPIGAIQCVTSSRIALACGIFSASTIQYPHGYLHIINQSALGGRPATELTVVSRLPNISARNFWISSGPYYRCDIEPRAANEQVSIHRDQVDCTLRLLRSRDVSYVLL